MFLCTHPALFNEVKPLFRYRDEASLVEVADGFLEDLLAYAKDFVDVLGRRLVAEDGVSSVLF